MAGKTRQDIQRTVGAIDTALAASPALSSQQLEAVRALREEMRRLYREGRTGDARDCEKRALAIIKEGSPAPE